MTPRPCTDLRYLLLSHGIYTAYHSQYMQRAEPGDYVPSYWLRGGSVAEWLACWTQAQKGPGSNRSREAVG